MSFYGSLYAPELIKSLIRYLLLPFTWDEVDDAEDAVYGLPGGDGRDLTGVGLMPHLVGNTVHHQQRLTIEYIGTCADIEGYDAEASMLIMASSLHPPTNPVVSFWTFSSNTPGEE